ncbi:MAG: leucine--tRNA ligase, partial [Deltaproteobacteria bacterium]|nr:leucine--tRNA ligase [Deltaproteobacteria bacterium]
ITTYAQELLDDLDTLTDWPARIVTQQRNWIGKSEGARVAFEVAEHEAVIEIFTTRLDTIHGCTYVVLAPEHPLAAKIATAKRQSQVSAFIEKMRQTDRIERTAVGGKKEGVFTGSYAQNPYTGEKVPVWLANFVLADYGTGAVMSVPAHDQRDFEFAQAYDLPIRPVIMPETGAPWVAPLTQAFTDDGVLADSGPFSKLSSAEARQRMAAHAQERGFGEATLHWHLRDWGFSRQRYWGTPIPIIYCEKDGTVPVPESDLPVQLPDFDATALTGTGGAPLAKLKAFYETTCPKCKGPARREVETMDTFVDSTWYYARFASPRYGEGPVDPEQARRWLPIDIYVGGPEHAVMHLLYFRFWTKAMRDLGLITFDEPARRLITQGMVNALAFRCAEHGYVPAAEYRNKPEAERVCPKCNKPLLAAVEKMSKSKYNGVDPMDLIDQYGADTARLYTLFAAPPEKDLEWSPESVEGLYRFAGRVFRVSLAQAARVRGASLPRSMQGLAGADLEVRRAVHRALAKVTADIAERTHFNTAIAALMELVNTLHEHQMHVGGKVSPGVAAETLQLLAQMLAPFAPHLAEEVWAAAGGKGLVGHSRWPTPDPESLTRDTVRIAVQVNGKLRGQIEVEPSAAESAVAALARQDANVTRHLEGKSVRKQIYVPGRLINFVAG